MCIECGGFSNKDHVNSDDLPEKEEIMEVAYLKKSGETKIPFWANKPIRSGKRTINNKRSFKKR